MRKVFRWTNYLPGWILIAETKPFHLNLNYVHLILPFCISSREFSTNTLHRLALQTFQPNFNHSSFTPWRTTKKTPRNQPLYLHPSRLHQHHTHIHQNTRSSFIITRLATSEEEQRAALRRRAVFGVVAEKINDRKSSGRKVCTRKNYTHTRVWPPRDECTYIARRARRAAALYHRLDERAQKGTVSVMCFVRARAWFSASAINKRLQFDCDFRARSTRLMLSFRRCAWLYWPLVVREVGKEASDAGTEMTMVFLIMFDVADS